MLRVKPVPNPEDLFSEEALIRRAEKKLGQMMHSTRMNLVSFNPQPAYPPPRFSLTSLSSRARDAMLNTARLEAEAWLNDTRSQAAEQKRFMQMESRLSEWHEQREAARKAEDDRQRVLEEEKEKVAVADRSKWKKRGESLRDQVAQWGAEKAMREEKEARDNAAAAEATKKLEAEKTMRHRKMLKARLARWHQGLPVDAAPKNLPAIEDALKTGNADMNAQVSVEEKKVPTQSEAAVRSNPCIDIGDKKSVTVETLKIVYGNAARSAVGDKVE
jgi:hypothetical protein